MHISYNTIIIIISITAPLKGKVSEGLEKNRCPILSSSHSVRSRFTGFSRSCPSNSPVTFGESEWNGFITLFRHI